MMRYPTLAASQFAALGAVLALCATASAQSAHHAQALPASTYALSAVTAPKRVVQSPSIMPSPLPSLATARLAHSLSAASLALAAPEFTPQLPQAPSLQISLK